MGKSTLKIDRYWLSLGDAGFLLFFSGCFKWFWETPLRDEFHEHQTNVEVNIALGSPYLKKKWYLDVSRFKIPNHRGPNYFQVVVLNMFYFHPYVGRRFPFWLIFFRWVVQPPTSISWAIHLWGLKNWKLANESLPGLVEKPSLGSLAGKLCQGWKFWNSIGDGWVMQNGDTFAA